MKVYLTLHNAELMIESSLGAALNVFPKEELTVIDVGSEDAGPARVERMGVEVVRLGRIDGGEYTEMREEMSRMYDSVFWIDADEVWPKECILNVQRGLETHDMVHGFWRNLDVREDGKIWASSFASRGCVAWKTDVFRIHRPWPREKMQARDPEVKREDVEWIPKNPRDVFCWHAVLLNLSPLPEKKARWKKRAERRDAFNRLEWERFSDLPFTFHDKRLLEPAKFDWYK